MTHDPSVIPVAAEAAEKKFIEQRRQLQDPPHTPDRNAPWGLALSGGGIRSATFALGVLQALARSPVRSAAQPPYVAATGMPAGAMHKASLLSRFDYLSTVSGGGYVGAFLCSIFLPGRLRAKSIAAAGPDPAARAADDAVRVLLTDPPSRMRSGDAYTEDTVRKAPLAWLRDNGRYLTPSGGGDMVYALCLSLRNWVAVHYVIGTALLGLFSFSALFTTLCSFLRDHDAAQLQQVLQAYTWTERFWWSPLWWLAGLVLLLGAVPAGLAFWLSYPGPRDRCDFFNRAVCGYIAVGLGLLALASSQHWLLQPDVAIAPLRASSLGTAYLAAGVLGLSLLLHGYNRRRSDEVATLRVESTRQFTAAMVCVAVIAGLALIETAGRSLYIVAVSGGGTTALATPAALIAALVGLARQTTALFGKTRAPSSWLGRLPLSTLGGAAGVLILALVATGWSLAVAWLQWGGSLPTVEAVSRGQAAVLCVLTLMAALLAALTGQFPGFINLSSLQSFYSARLTRAYLGASNGRRFIRTPGAGAAGREQSVAEPMAGDQIALSQFVDDAQGPRTLAPFHIINVTVNKTVDPAEQLVQRDRKGQPMAVTPQGFAVDGRPFAFPSKTQGREIQRPLTLGQWIGTSGAAFSTGIGRETTLGMSLLMGAANVRLGTWWESGAGGSGQAGLLRSALTYFFTTQSYLLGEFTAKFHGLHRPWQYLSDGGHFENTALYELLRPGRGLRCILACDNGADPTFEFADLANLIRLVRIDMGVEVEVDKSVVDDPVLNTVFGRPQDFSNAGDGTPAGREPCALLLRARPAGPDAGPICWIVLLKPRVRNDSADDIRQYKLSHPRFPQEPTADQFFDEAQWESYRKLGLDNAGKVLAPRMRRALLKHIVRQQRS